MPCGRPARARLPRPHFRFPRAVMAAVCALACGLGSKAEPGAYFRNLRLDPDALRLSWDAARRDPDVACQKDDLDPEPAEVGKNSCTFPSLSLCRVTNFSVHAPGRPSAWMLFPEPDPNPEAAAVNLSCRVHDARMMTCVWGRGLGAPRDVRYRMFWRQASLSRKFDRECPTDAYVLDPRGTRLGCRLDDVSGLPPHVTVTVNASNAVMAAAAGPCVDASVDLEAVEVLAPPTLTAECNGSAAARLRWEARSLSYSRFKFDIEINRSSRAQPETIKIEENFYRVVNPGTFSVRVMATTLKDGKKSTWSETRRLACDAQEDAGTGAVIAVVAVVTPLAALGTLLLLLCWRASLTARLFPPIPRVKDPMAADKAAAVELVPWGADRDDCDVTQVTET